MEVYMDNQDKVNIITIMIHGYLTKMMENGQILQDNAKVITQLLEDFIIQ